ncbi:MAG: PAS domain S-box protein [Ilumatobacteraceae bacterium]
MIAEGVEDPVQVDALIRLGADEAQGFLFGSPGPIDELAERIERQRSAYVGGGDAAKAFDHRADGLPVDRLPGAGTPLSRLLVAALATAHDAIVVTDAAAPVPQIIHVNARFEAETGSHAADVVGLPVTTLLRHTTDPELAAWYRVVLAGEQSASRELGMFRLDGTPYLCELTVSPIFDEYGRLTHWLHANRDISERRVLEEERARFEWTIEQSDSLVVMYDTRGNWLYANTAMRDAVGIERGASLDGVSNDLVGITSGPFAAVALDEVREALRTIGRWSGPWVLDNRNTKAVTEVHCELQQIADPLDAGRSFIVAVGRDVTEANVRERTERRRRDLSTVVAQLTQWAVERSGDDVLADLDAAIAPVAEMLGADVLFVNVIDGDWVRTAALWSYEPALTQPDSPWRRPVPVDEVPAWLDLVSSQRVVVDPAPGQWSAELAASFPGKSFGSHVIAGLVMDGKLLGALGAATSAHGRAWSEDELAAIQQLAHVIANVIQRQRADRTVLADMRAATTRAAFDRVQMAVAQWALGLDRGSIADGLDTHLQQIGELLGVDSVTLVLQEGERLVRSSRWPRTARSPLGVPPRMMYTEMMTKLPDLEPLIVEDIETADAPYAATWRSDPAAPRAAMIVPLGAGGHFDGVLTVVVEHDARRWTEPEVAFVRGIAGVISSHIGRLKVEDSLRESQARFEALLDGSSDFVLVVDDRAIVRYANSALRRNLDMTIEQLVGLSGFELIHEEDRPLAVQRFAALMERNPTENTRVRAMRSDGSVAGWWEILSGAQRNPLVGGTILTARDVTTHVIAERAEALRVARLRHTFELAQSALDIGPDAFLAQLDDACAAIAEMLGADAAWVAQIDEASEVVSRIGRAGALVDEVLTVPFSATPNWVQRLRQPTPVHLRPGDPDEPWTAEWRAHSGCKGEMMAVAMSVAGQLVGELGVAMTDAAREWDEDAMAYLRIVADTFAHVLERERLDAALRASEARFRILSETAADVVILIDDRGTIAYASPSSSTLLGYSPADLIGHEATLLLPSGQGDLTRLLDDRSSRAGSVTAELQMRRADGELIWVAHSTSAVLDARSNSRVTYRISLRDITERKRLETELSWQALHDPLTGLGNRIQLQRRLADATVDAGRGRGLAVLLIDLDKFKQVNDTLGHAHGDEVLRIVSARLTKLTRPSDTLTRTGGDEFVVLCPNTDAADAVAVGERIVRVLCEPIATHGEVVVIGASVGVSHTRTSSDDGDHLLIQADRAMYAAKESGGNRVVVA